MKIAKKWETENKKKSGCVQLDFNKKGGLGGGGEIRTHGSFKASTVFKTAAFNRSATPPLGEVHFIRFLSKSVTIEENYLIFKNDEII